MRSHAAVLVVLSGLVFVVASPVDSAEVAVQPVSDAPEAPAYPPARRGDVTDTFHGVQVPDPYRWMEDLRDPALNTWIEAQNLLSGPYLDDAARFDAIRGRMTLLADLFPTREAEREAGGRVFFRELMDGKVRLYVREPQVAAARVLLDPETLGEGLALKAYVPAPDGRHVAYLVGASGTDWGEVRIRDVASGRDLPDVLADVRFQGPFHWTADGLGLVYRRFAPPRDGRRELPAEDPAIYLHRLAQPTADDLRLFALPEDRRDWSLTLGLPGDRRQLFAYVERGPWGPGNLGGSRSQLHVLALDASGQPVDDTGARQLSEPDAAYRVVHAESGRAWVFTNLDAPRGRVVLMNLENPAPNHWKTLVPETDGVLTDVAWLGGRLVTHRFENVHSAVRVFAPTGKPIGEIALPGTGVVQGLEGSASSSQVRMMYSGLLQPPVLLRHDLDRGTTTTESSNGQAPDLTGFEVRQEWFASKDGTRVPMFVVLRRGLARDGSHPTLLYGYGASGTSTLPVFSEDSVAWVQMGGIYAIANLRGGGEFGNAWYQAAVRERKQTTFDDLIAASEHLIAQGWTSPRKLAISGASNGGLLVTATMLQRPDLFGAVLADVPVTDALRRHFSGNGLQQVDQWGTPDDPAVFPALRAYSPVHNVGQGRCYPATLITTSRDDDRMPPWHAYKLTAALQAAQSCPKPILLSVRDSGGHGGGDGDAWLTSAARQLNFLARELGMTVAP